jgi:hypothetical protein
MPRHCPLQAEAAAGQKIKTVLLFYTAKYEEVMKTSGLTSGA